MSIDPKIPIELMKAIIKKFDSQHAFWMISILLKAEMAGIKTLKEFSEIVFETIPNALRERNKYVRTT